MKRSQEIYYTSPFSDEVNFILKKLNGTNCFSDFELDKYSIFRINSNGGEIRIDANEYTIDKECVFFLAPGQRVTIDEGVVNYGDAMFFDSGFYCLKNDDSVVQCNGVLFNTLNMYSFIEIHDDASQLEDSLKQLRFEFAMEVPQHEILLAMFKIFLIRCLGMFEKQNRVQCELKQNLPEPILAFGRQVELNFKKLHYPIEYADKINVTLTTLGKLTREFLNKTLTQIIQERIVKEAKKELLGSNKSIKEIARELGFKDEYYFNRLFEQSTNISPIHFRKYN